MTINRVGMIGFGEAGRAIAQSLTAQDPSVVIHAFDKAPTAAMAGGAATLVQSPFELAQNSDLIFSVVTADEAVSAAKAIAPFLTKSHYLLDGNSVSPGTKRQAAELITSHDACYCDMAIMAPIHPRGHKTPILLSGSGRDVLEPLCEKWDFSYAWEGEAVGQASIVKMLRSILIKGMECLITESVTASQALGLDERILQSAGKTLGIADMPALADYVMERAATHGRRRAAEMREVAKTLDELGLSNDMSSAIAIMQDRIADMALAEKFDSAIPQDRAAIAPLMRAAQISE